MQCLIEGADIPSKVKVLHVYGTWALCLLNDKHGRSFIVRAKWQHRENPLEQVLTEGQILITVEDFERAAESLQKYKVDEEL